MTTLTAQPKPISTAEMPPEFRELPPMKPDRMARPKAWVRRHHHTIAWLLPILVGSGLVNAINLAGSPQQIDDEGTYTAQAWSVLNLGQLTHYTYWYDHPPLGWIQIAAWTGLTDGFGRYPIAVIAGREAMIVAMLASVAVLWFLARRIGFSRGAAAAATIIFAVSPLAVQFHRTVYLDNVATPWLLGAILLAMTRRRQLLGFAAAAACLGIAVLSKETYLLALPLVGWLMWRNARPETRRYTLAVAATILVLFGFSYVLLALVKGELFPSSHHTSLIAGVEYQLATRSPSGSLFNPHSLMNKTIGEWFQLDPVQVVVAPLAGIAGLFIRRLRPFAIALLALVVFMFRPGGYLPVPYVIMLLPLSAIVIAGVGEWAVRSWRSRPGARRLPNIAIAVLTLGALVVAVPAWGSQLRGLLLANLDGTTVQAEQWVERYVPKDSRVIVDDSMWVDFVEHGFARDNVIWFYKLDTDSAVKAQSPQGWKDSDYVISTESMRTSPDAASADDAISNSEVVASFGTGTQLVQVRRIEPEGLAKARAVNSSAASVRASTGQAVAQNTQLTSSAQDIARLKAGQVDPRISLVLGQLLADGSVIVSGLPKIAGEGGDLFRQVDLRSVDGSALVRDGSLTAEGRMVVESLSGPYAPEYHSVTPSGLRLTYSIVPPADLIQ